MPKRESTARKLSIARSGGLRLRSLYVLREGNSDLGSLRRERMLGSLSTAVIGRKSWTFKRTGFLAPRLTMRAKNQQQDLAVFRPSWLRSGGALEFRDGRQLLFRGSFWGNRWVWVDSHDRTLMTFGARRLLRSGCEIAVSPSGAERDDVGLLALFGWYVRILADEDSAVMMGAVA